MRRGSPTIALAAAFVAYASLANALSLKDAVEHAVYTNPKVGVAQAQRRAADYGLMQAQGRFLPQVSLEADTGEQKVASQVNELSPGNNRWLDRRQVAVSASQILFDGWDRHYDVLKNAARVDAAALQVLDRSEVTGLDAVEAYIDVLRQNEVLAVARHNVTRHDDILGRVRTQYEGGKVPLSNVNQIQGRVEAAQATVAVTERQVQDTQADFHETIGLEARGLQPAPWPAGVPRSKADAIEVAVVNNPAVRAALADIDVAAHARDQSHSAFYPEVSLEGSARQSEDIDGNPGYSNEYVGKLVLRWKIFDGLIRHGRYRELSERLTAAQLQADVRRRSAVKSVEKAWSSLQTGRERVAVLERQVAADEKVVTAFLEEYELSRRTLLEVLDAESVLFNAKVQLIGARSIRLFAAYQLLASTGTMLQSLGIAPPLEAAADVQSREQYHHLGPFDVLLEPLGSQ